MGTLRRIFKEKLSKITCVLRAASSKKDFCIICQEKCIEVASITGNIEKGKKLTGTSHINRLHTNFAPTFLQKYQG